MREAIGSSLLFNLVIVFVSLIILFFIGTLSYSKAYKVKNRIVSIIEKYEGYSNGAINKINVTLGSDEVGYSIGTVDCEKYLETGFTLKSTTGYRYCVFERILRDDPKLGTQKYYKVITFTHFDFPVIGSFIEFPVKGETNILGKKYSY